MNLFYRIMLWLCDRELTIAMNTGRSPANIKALRADVTKWARAVEDSDIQTRYN